MWVWLYERDSSQVRVDHLHHIVYAHLLTWPNCQTKKDTWYPEEKEEEVPGLHLKSVESADKNDSEDNEYDYDDGFLSSDASDDEWRDELWDFMRQNKVTKKETPHQLLQRFTRADADPKKEGKEADLNNLGIHADTDEDEGSATESDDGESGLFPGSRRSRRGPDLDLIYPRIGNLRF